MKQLVALATVLVVALGVSDPGLAQSGGMVGMDMKEKVGDSSVPIITHQTTGIVKKVDNTRGTVTLDHQPVKSLNWPAMTMSFSVNDKKLMERLQPGKKVAIDFVQQGRNSVITAVR